MKQFEFKPFDKVLVRDSNNGPWRANFYSHLDNNNDAVCVHGIWNYCIPYNEETKHLIGTTNEYEPEEPKKWEVRSQNGLFAEKFTSKELLRFIETAVINNKDITNFNVTCIF